MEKFFAKVKLENIKEGAKNLTGADDSVSEDTIISNISSVLTWVFAIIGIIAVVMIIYGGVIMITSSGDPGKINKGKAAAIWGVVGLVVALLAFLIVNLVLTNV